MALGLQNVCTAAFWVAPGLHAVCEQLDLSQLVVMGNQTDYFEKIGYRPCYQIGDRITGQWNGIPFCGSVGNDTLINHEQGPRVSVHVDLPICYHGKVYTVIMVKHSQIRPLPLWDTDKPRRNDRKKT